MHIVVYILSFLFAIFFLVLIHEFGHFIVARFFKVRVERFSIGFGKPFYMWKGKSSRTEYAIAPFLFGGYIKLLDTREGKVAKKDLPFAFDKKPILQRMAIILSGPLTNIIFAIFAFWLLFVIGIKTPKPIVGKVVPHSLASVAGVKAGDEIIQADNRRVYDWQDVVIAMLARVGDKGDLKLVVQPSPMSSAKTYYLKVDNWRLDPYEPNPLKDFGLIEFQPNIPAVINSISNNGPAANAGLLKGDQVTAVNGRKVNNWLDFIEFVKVRPQQRIILSLIRMKQHVDVAVTTDWKYGPGWKKIGFLGIGSLSVAWPDQAMRTHKYNVPQACLRGLRQIWSFTDLNGIVLKKLVTGKISLRILGGPISIFSASSQAIQQGLVVFLGFLGMISLMLALINILPLPGLDGGFFVLLIIEAIIGRAISNRVQLLIFRLGLILFLVLIVQATINDLVRLFSF